MSFAVSMPGVSMAEMFDETECEAMRRLVSCEIDLQPNWSMRNLIQAARYADFYCGSAGLNAANVDMVNSLTP